MIETNQEEKAQSSPQYRQSLAHENFNSKNRIHVLRSQIEQLDGAYLKNTQENTLKDISAPSPMLVLFSILFINRKLVFQ